LAITSGTTAIPLSVRIPSACGVVGRVRALEEDPAPEQVGVVGVDHPAQRRGDEGVARRREELRRAHRPDALLDVVAELPALVEVATQGVRVDLPLATQGARGVRHAEHPRPEVLEDPRRPRPDVPEALHGHRQHSSHRGVLRSPREPKDRLAGLTVIELSAIHRSLARSRSSLDPIAQRA